MGWSQGNDREERHEKATGSGLMGHPLIMWWLALGNLGGRLAFLALTFSLPLDQEGCMP